MKKSRNIFTLFLQVAAFLIFTAYTAYALSVDTQEKKGTHSTSLALSLDSPALSELSIKGHERHYIVVGDAVISEGDDGPYTYKCECDFDTETMVLTESARFLRTGTGEAYTHYIPF